MGCSLPTTTTSSLRLNLVAAFPPRYGPVHISCSWDRKVSARPLAPALEFFSGGSKSWGAPIPIQLDAVVHSPQAVFVGVTRFRYLCVCVVLLEVGGIPMLHG